MPAPHGPVKDPPCTWTRHAPHPVEALDTAGAVVERRIWAIPGGINGFQQAYFAIPNLPPARDYRVLVWDDTLTQS